MAKTTFLCWSCRKPTEIEDLIGRRDTCPHCGADMRSCKNCTFYDTTSHHECREPTAEWVADKERGNFCGYFKPFSGQRAAADDATAAKAKLEALFEKK